MDGICNETKEICCKKVFAIGKNQGRFGLNINEKIANFMNSRSLSLFLTAKLCWLEDGAQVVCQQLVSDKVNASDYFRYKYPDSFPLELRLTATKDERRTLKFRFRYVLRCLLLVVERYNEWHKWHFSACGSTLSILHNFLKQILGEAAAAPFLALVKRMEGLWDEVNWSIGGEQDARRELMSMLDEVDAVFEDICDKFRAREAEMKAEAEAKAREASAVEKLAEDVGELNERSKKNAKNIKRIAVTGERVIHELHAKEPEDQYSAEAGLENCNSARRRMIEVARELSKKEYPVVMGAKSGENSIAGLAELTWERNREEFEGLAKKGGYKNPKSLAAKLYKLAKTHPCADYFRWM